MIERAGRLLGVVVDQGATELRRQRLLRPGLGTHLGRQGRVARIALHRSGGARIGLAVLAGIDRQRRTRCILLLVRARRRRGARRSVIRARPGSRGFVTRRSLQRRIAVGRVRADTASSAQVQRARDRPDRRDCSVERIAAPRPAAPRQPEAADAPADRTWPGDPRRPRPAAADKPAEVDTPEAADTPEEVDKPGEAGNIAPKLGRRLSPNRSTVPRWHQPCGKPFPLP